MPSLLLLHHRFLPLGAIVVALAACEGKPAGAKNSEAEAGATKNSEAGAGATKNAGGGAARVRVQVREAKCEVGIPSSMSVVGAKESGFTIVENGRDPDLYGMLVVLMPVGPMGGLAPPGATDVKVLKDKKAPDGAVEREGSFNNGVQTLHVAEYVYPVGKQWLHCKIQAAQQARRDEIAKLCSGLEPKAL